MSIEDDAGHPEETLVDEEVTGGIEQRHTKETRRRNATPMKLSRWHEVYRKCHGALIRSMGEIELLYEVCRIIVEQGGYRFAWVGYAKSDASRSIRPVAQAGFEEGYLEERHVTSLEKDEKHNPAGITIHTGTPTICRNILSDPAFESLRAEAENLGYASLIALPLTANGETYGAMNIYASEHDAFDSTEVLLLAETAKDISYGIASMRARLEGERMKESLRKSEEQFKTIFNSASDAIMIHDFQGHFLEVNETACKRLGYTRDEFLRMTPVDIDSPEYARLAMQRIDDIQRKGQAVFETVYVTSDGETFPIELNARVIEFEGKPAILSVARDVTERKNAEQALRDSEEKYSKLFHESNDAIFIHDLEGNIIDVNQRVIDLLGYEREEVLKLNVRDLHPPGALAQSKEAFDTVTECGHVNFEIKFKKKSGEIFEADVSSSLFDIGNRKVIQGIVRDLTERRKAEKELRETQELYETLVRTSPDAITTSDLSGNITYVSQNTLLLHGYEHADELIGKNALDLIAPEEHDRAIKNIQRTLTHGSVQNVEYTLFRKDGTRFTGELNAALVKNEDGKPLFFIASVRDVTDRKRIEEQLRQAQKMEAIGALAGGMAHDFNNLLIPVLGYADLLLLKLGERDASLTQYVSEIKKTAERAVALTKQLLTLGRRQMLTMIVLDLNALVSNLENMLRRLIGEDIEFYLALEPCLMPIKADPSQIELIIINLVVNARDAMPEGGTLTIQTENVSFDRETAGTMHDAEPGDYVCLTVKDTGIGMDSMTLERIFEPFFSTKEDSRGTGLGLSTVYGSVKQHDGWIDVQSGKGQGSSFRIYLPANLRIAEERNDEDVQMHDIRGNNERILLVEDDNAVRDLTENILTKNGYIVIGARNAKEALEICAREEQSIDLVFSDVVLPGKSGIQLAEELLAFNPVLKVILSSGYAAPRSLWNLIHEKGYRFLQKPYKMVDLLKVVKEMCESSEPSS
jgi:two-component system cell cycle sensor histidine kinase/response regulator CckA